MFQKLLLTEFAAELTSLLELVLATFDAGMDHSKRYATIEKKFQNLKYDEENAVLKVLIEVQMLLAEVELWDMNVELAAKKSQ